MNQEFVLGKLSSLMGWDEESAQREFAWLRLMSRMKYDSYQDFLAGIRFIESLAYWLQQFEFAERPAAYEFVRKNLVFIGTAEMRHLVELFFPETIQPRLLRWVAESREIPQYQVWVDADAVQLYRTMLRKTLFIELSDGARIDLFRRSNAGVISNEQVVTTPRLIRGKWDDLLSDLRKATGNPEERFAAVYLVDDFIGSGTTLLRKRKGAWSGKLVRFWDDVGEVVASHFEPDWTVCVHHYISTFRADQDVRTNNDVVRSEKGAANWFANIEFTCGMLLPQGFPIDLRQHPEFGKLLQKYYDNSIESEHIKLGGDDAHLGFGKCALPLILEHNTPNNSIALLWTETAGSAAGPAMRPQGFSFFHAAQSLPRGRGRESVRRIAFPRGLNLFPHRLPTPLAFHFEKVKSPGCAPCFAVGSGTYNGVETPMDNPFLRRATEFLRDDEAFLAIVSPEPVTYFLGRPGKAGTLYDRLVLVRGTPGSGKTTLARLFEFPTFCALLRNKSFAGHKDLTAALTACGAIHDDQPRVLGCRLPLEADYRDFWEFPYSDELKANLMAALLQARTILGWFRHLRAAGIDDNQVRLVVQPQSQEVVDTIGGVNGVQVRNRAAEVENAIYNVMTALVAPPESRLPPDVIAPYRPFDAAGRIARHRRREPPGRLFFCARIDRRLERNLLPTRPRTKPCSRSTFPNQRWNNSRSSISTMRQSAADAQYHS